MVLDHLVIQRMDTTGRTVLSKSAAPTYACREWTCYGVVHYLMPCLLWQQHSFQQRRIVSDIEVWSRGAFQRRRWWWSGQESSGMVLMSTMLESCRSSCYIVGAGDGHRWDIESGWRPANSSRSVAIVRAGASIQIQGQPWYSLTGYLSVDFEVRLGGCCRCQGVILSELPIANM